MSDFSFFSDVILAGIENPTTFTPEILIRLIGFMLMLEFLGSVFGTLSDAVGMARKR